MLAVTSIDGADGWARAFGPAEGLDPFDNKATIFAVTTDAAGSRYVGGEYFGTVDFDPGTAVVSRTTAQPSGFVAKFSAAGALQAVWTLDASATSATPAAVKVSALAVASTGRLAVAGSFSGTADLNPTSTTLLRTAVDEDGFALLLGSDGSWQNALTTYDLNVPGYSSTVGVTQVAFASATDVYVAGNYTYTSTMDFLSGDDAYVLRIDFNPNTIATGVLWQEALGGYAAYAGGLAVDATGLVLSASFTGSLEFVNNFASGATTEGSQGGIVISYAADGSPRWASILPDHATSYVLPWGNSVIDNALPVAVSGDGATIYVATSEIIGDSIASTTRSVIRALHNSGTDAGTPLGGWSPVATTTLFAAASPIDSLVRSLHASGSRLLVGGQATTPGGGTAFLLAATSSTTGTVSGILSLASGSPPTGDEQANEVTNFVATVGSDGRYVVAGGLTGAASFATSSSRASLDVGAMPAALVASLANPFVTGPEAPFVRLTSDTGSSATDRITKVGTLAVTGTETGARIEYSVNGGTTWGTTFTPLEGKNSVQVRQVTTVASQATPFEFTLDTKAPSSLVVSLTTDTGSSAVDKITQSGVLAVSGTEAGAVVQYSANNGSTWTSAFTAVEGANTVLVRQTDTAGNISTSASLSFTRDTSAPAAPKVALASDTGSSLTDKLTSIATLAVTGTETGAKIEYSTDGGTNWTPTFTAVEGKNAVQVRQVDFAGNASPAASFEFTRDTTAPVAPIIALASDTGTSNSDRITKVGTLALTGNEPGAKIEYSVNNGSTWATTFAPAQGAVTVLARQTDAAGNISARSLPLAITFDTVAPAAPVVVLANDTGTSATDRITADASLKVTGAEAGATVEYSIDSGKSWSPTFAAVEGANSVAVRQTDLAGNISLASTPLAFTLRTVTAAAPVVALASDTGSSATDRITKIGTLAVTGTETGARIEYSTNNGTTWATAFTPVEGKNVVQVRQVGAVSTSAATPFEFTLDTKAAAPIVSLTTDTGSSAVDKITQSGVLAVSGTEAGAVVQYSANNGSTWTSAFTAVEGANTVLVRQTDTAGNISTSASLSFTRDTSAPAAPKVALASDTGTSLTDKLTTVATLAVTGTETGAKVEYSTDGGTNWTPTFNAVEGKNAVQVRQADLAGNASPAVAFEFTRDTTAPVAPIIALASDTGASNSDRITKVGTLALTGNEPGAKIEYSVNNGSTWTTTFAPAQGAVTVLARQTDAAGNISARSLPLAITFDTVAPAAPVVALANDTGTSATDRITADASLKVTGAEAGATVEYSIDSGKNWSPTFTAAEGANSVQVRQTDLAGNISLASTPLAFTLRTVTAAAPVVALASDTGSSATDKITKIGTLAVTGTETGARIEYSVNGGSTWGTTFTPVEGKNIVQVRQVGAVSTSPGTPFEFTLDTKAAAPIVSLTTDTGSSAADRITQAGALTVSGTEAGAVVQYSADNGRTWTSAFSAVERANTVLVRQTDTAGNISTSASLSFTRDTTAPVAPKVALKSDTGTSNSDKLTSVATLAVTGTETGARIEYSTDSGKNWTPSFSAVEGNNSVQVRQVDLAGNASPAASFEFTRDTTAPAAPVIALASDTGASNSDRITKVGTLALTGNEPGAKIEYSVNNGSTWTTTFAPAQGAVTVLARQTDAAGNISARSLPLAITFDTVAPAAPVVALANDTGTSATDRITADASLKVTGAEAGATVEYSIDKGLTWAKTFTAVEGANSVAVRQTDLAGNISLASTPLAFTLRTVTAAAPVVALASDTGSSATDRITKIGTLAVTGTETGARIEYSTNNGTTWATTFTPVEGKNVVQVRQVTLTRVSSPTTLEFVRDSLVPATPTISLKTDTGTLGTDRVTSNAELLLGAIESGAVIEYTTNGTTWTPSFTPGQGAITAAVRQTDLAGNVSARSTPLSFTFDTTPPAVLSMAFAAQTRSISVVFNKPVAGVTLDDFRISGITAAGAIDMRLDDPRLATLFGTITLAGTGLSRTLTFAKITRPVSGSYTLSLSPSGSNIIDVAGNLLAAGTSVTFTG